MADEQNPETHVGATDRPGVTLVTPDNFDAYVDEKLGVPANPDPEVAAAAELEEVEAKKAETEQKAAEPKEGDVDGNKVYFKGKWTPKHDFSYRLHLKTEETRKEAQEKVDKAAAEAKALREEREALAKERDELKAKYEPPKSTEIGPEPKMGDYTDTNEYLKARDEWVADKTRKEDAQRAEGERQTKEREDAVKRWNERQEAVKAKIPDYADKIANSSVKVSDQMRDAIIESEVGPEILAHLADNPEIAESLGKMTVGKMLREFGKLEVTLGGTAKPEPKSDGKGAAEISKAPAPITPLRGGSAGAGTKFDSSGNFTGTFEEFKALRNAGKIK